MAADEISLPTKDELRLLPGLARVAFAARCARRVLPALGEINDRFANGELVGRLSSICDTVEQGAGAQLRDLHSLVMSLRSTGRRAHDTDLSIGDSGLSRQYPGPSARAQEVARSLFAAAEAGAKVAEGMIVLLDRNENASVLAERASTDSARLTSDAVRNAAFAASHDGRTTDDAYSVAENAMRRDYELLKAAAAAEGWTDDTPVPPEFFGPLWPEGEPEGWPGSSVPAEPTYFKIELLTPSNMTGQESEDFNRRAAALFAELSALHVAMGGTGLRLLDRDSLETIPVSDEMPIPDGSHVGGAC